MQSKKRNTFLKNTFFDESFEFDTSLLYELNIENMTSWAYIELYATMKGIEINEDYVCSLLCGIFMVKTVYDMFLDTFKTTNFLDKYISTSPKILQLIEILSLQKLLSAVTKEKYRIDINHIIEYWHIWCDMHNVFRDDTIFELSKEEILNTQNKRKYELFSILFNKNPIIFAKFYDKQKRSLHLLDPSLVNWLIKKFASIASKSKVYEEIYKAILKETNNQNKISMFLN